MKSLITASLIALTLIGCNKGSTPSSVSPWCTIVAPVDDMIVQGLVSKGCTGQNAILLSIQKIESCAIPAPSPVAAKALALGPISSICSVAAPLVIAALLPIGTGAIIPADWACPANIGVAELSAGAATLCQFIPAAKPSVK